MSVLVPAWWSDSAVFLHCRMIVKRNIIDSPFGGPKPQEILCSNDYSTAKSYNQYYRTGNAEDPWLSYHDHGTSSMMYGEACKYGMLMVNNFSIFDLFIVVCSLFYSAYRGHSENVLKNGMNVWIYPPPKNYAISTCHVSY